MMTKIHFKTDLDNEHIAGLDFTESVPCDNPDCFEGADWNLRLACCGHLFGLCQEHLDENIAWLRRNAGRKADCEICFNVVTISVGFFVIIGPTSK